MPVNTLDPAPRVPADDTHALAVEAATHLQRAETLLGAGALDEARTFASRAVDIWPTAAHLLLGRIALRKGDFAEAIRVLRQAVALEDTEQARLLLIAGLSGAGQVREALDLLEVLDRQITETPERLFQMGGLYEGLQYYDMAARYFLRSLALDSTVVRIWHRLGNALLMENNVVGATEAFSMALQMAPENVDYRIDLGTAHARAGRFGEALDCALSALQSRPDNVLALNNAGYALQCLNRSAEACVFYDRAAVLSPDYAPVRFGRAIARLKNNDFEQGWSEFEWRWQHGQQMRTDVNAPLWCGEPLEGKTLLLHAEQGFGDTLQFIRFARDLAARGARVLAHVPLPLVRLLESVEGLEGVYGHWDGSIAVDYHCPLLGVAAPLALRPAELPAASYLSVPDIMCETQGATLRQRVCGTDTTPDLIVGLVWAGDPRPHDKAATLTDSRRSMKLADFAPLFAVEKVRFVSFQLGVARSQMEEDNFPVLDAMDGVTDFQDTAARLSGIDLLISVDTSMVHLAGGLGIPVWMLSRADGCWRWGEKGHQTPWYPKMRIIRQHSPYDWRAPVAEAHRCLTQVASVYQQELVRGT